MKESDLHREWARVLDMCEGTKVSPFVCWNRKGYDRLKPARHAPEFSEDPSSYEFAVAILEERPLFIGDKVWSKLLDDWYIITDDTVNFTHMSWNKPKETFMLNGEELPCPVKMESYAILISGNIDECYTFPSSEERNKVENAINKLLKESTGNGE